MPQTQPTRTTAPTELDADPSRNGGTSSAADGQCRCPGCGTWWPAALAVPDVRDL